MSEEYPYPCCRCGFCCLHETCPVGRYLYRVGKADPCPGLSFQDGVSVCEIALTRPEIIGVGCGCCIKATCYRAGIAYDFAGLPEGLKKLVAWQFKKGIQKTERRQG